MEVGAARDPHGVWGDPPVGTYVIPHSLQPKRSSHGAIPVPQQPVMILQQLPGTCLAPATGPPHVRGEPLTLADLIELMMIQNSQMHQVVMNNLAVSALTSFGFGPSPAAAQEMVVPLQTGEEEETVVFHHHYIPCPGPAPILAWPVLMQDQRPVALRYPGTGSLAEDGEPRAVPPPPPPSATGTVGPSVLPASEYYNMLEERL
ncbi:proline-rich protein 29 [Falco biarmicus]|uniref:proline-rich protein 29 n=1 Tax=Falco cherrug TaxID=345164 RepID=UPI000FFB3A75|nr:proline-rich protein 29 [Falco cherrug]XP_037267298.1 proline-rich protein 29 [Falco rusticolus]XP_056218123.1 proline-rich protein 29 [Falco biarmicus]